ncbi:MAG: Ig-like domain-containing protein [Pirellulales bacterium]|nr:Ig-like domain-containing protein [Pirellulales bacterium]
MSLFRHLPHRSRRRGCAACRSVRRAAPWLEALEPRHLLSGNPTITAIDPAGLATEPTASVLLNLSEPVLGAEARDAARYELVHLGVDRLPGGGDDLAVRVLPRYADGTTRIELSTVDDLSDWAETDYGFPRGIYGDWQLEEGGASVVQQINGGSTFFLGPDDVIGNRFTSRITVVDAGDDDYVGVVFGAQLHPETGLPDDFYLLAWKQAAQGAAHAGLTLAKVTATGTIGNRADLWTLDPADPHVEILAAGPAVGWQAQTDYDFQVDYQSNGTIDVLVTRSVDGAVVWDAGVVDASPLGDGRIGFYNYSQPGVRYTNLGPTGGLVDGYYQLTVRSGESGLHDLEGNPLDGDGDGTGGDDFVATFGLDTYAPAVSLALAAASDSGASPTDGITNVASPTFEVTVNKIGRIALDFDGDGTTDASQIVPGPGTYVLVGSYSADDAYTAVVVFEPASGDTVQDSMRVTLDRQAPSLLPGPSEAEAPWTQYTFTFDEPLDAATFTLADVALAELPGDPIAIASLSGEADQYTVHFPMLLAQGNYVFTVGPNVTDLAGNPMTAAAQRIVGLNPDELGPVVLGATIAPVGVSVVFFDLGGLDPATVTDLDNYTLAASGGDGALGDANDVDVSGLIGSIAFDPLSGTATLLTASPLPDERYRLGINGTLAGAVSDLSGNPLLGGADYDAMLDLDARPATVAVDLPGSWDTGMSESDNITFVPAPTFHVTVNEAGRIDLDLNGDGTPEFTRLVAAGGVHAFAVPALADNVYPVTARFTPAAGAVVQHVLTVTIDTHVPYVTTGHGTAQAPWRSQTIAFNESIDPGTLSVDDVRITRQGGVPVLPLAIVPVAGGYRIDFAYQVTPGAYSFVVGPDVKDVAGNQMNSPRDFSITLLPDATRPYVASLSPVGKTKQNVSRLTVQFNEPMLAGSFTTDDVAIAGPSGPLDPQQFTVSTLDERTFQIDLAEQSAEGDYTVSLGPAVSDLSGNAMLVAHQAVFSIDKTAPSVAGVVPSGTVGQAVSFVDVMFTETIQSATLTAGDVTLLSPGGSPLAITAIQPLGGNAYRMRFNTQSANGTYSLLIGPDVLDQAGNAMAAAFAGQFTVSLPDLTLDPTDPASLVAPGAALFGQTIEVGWIVDNLGTAPAQAPWTDRVWLSTDAVLDAGDTLLTTTAGPAVLDAAGEYVRNELVAIPLSESSVEGGYYVIVQTDAQGGVVEASEANNVLARPISLTLPPLPDLVVGDVVAPAVATPGTEVSVSWSVANQGTQPAEGTWVEAVYLSTDAAPGGDLLLGRFIRSGPFAAGDPPIVRTEAVMVPGTVPIGELRFVVVVDQDHNVIELSEGNNAAVAGQVTKVPGALSLALSKTHVAEDAGAVALRGTVTRSGPTAAPLVVMLTPSDPTELSAPATVTIPAGQKSVSFDIGVLSDGVVDGDQAVAIEAQAPDMVVGVAGVVVVDVDVPRLFIDLAFDEATEGDTWTVSVTRDTVSADPLTVLFSASLLDVLELPDDVVIPANEATIAFEITAVDDDLVKLTREITVEARAPGFISGTDAVDILDNDAPRMGLALDRSTASEGAGQHAILATITRSPAGTAAMTVLLSSSDTTELVAPQSVVIPAGATSVDVWLDAVDDALVDGPQSVALTATPTCYLGFPLATGAVQAPITIADDDGPALTVVIQKDLVAEGLSPAASVTVSRNTDTAGPLSVTLVSSDPGELAAPGSVVIPAGQASYTFSVDTIEDGESDGNQTVALTASADGFTSGTDVVVVSDVDLPDLVITQLTAPGTVLSETYFDLAYRVANEGLAAAVGSNAQDEFPGSWQDRVFLSSDPFVGNDVLLGTYEFVGALPLTAGLNSYSRTLPFRAPRESGEYWVVVVTDLAGTVAEGIETNNTRVFGPIQVEAAYTATVATQTETALAGTTVALSGTATATDTHLPAAFVLVNIHLEVRGTRRIISALTNAQGQFSVNFTPLPGEAGYYTVGAAHPGEASAPVQDAFTLLGMRAQPPGAAVAVIQGQTVQGQLTLHNLADVPLTDIEFELLDVPANLDVTISLPQGNLLGGMAALPIDFEVHAADASVPSAMVTLRLTSSEGASIDVPLAVSVTAFHSELVADAAELVAAVLRGGQRTVEFTVTNRGGAATGPIDVTLPAVSWLALATPAVMPSLAPGESASVTLTLTPPADLPLTAYQGNLALTASDSALSMPFTFRVVSEAKGDLAVTAIDELYYFTAEAPSLAGATVALLDAVTGAEIARATTDAQGDAVFSDVPEGYYTLDVRAEAHGDCRKTVFVTAGQTTPVLAFLTQQTVKYIWKVEETEIQDRTRISIQTVFETNVPAPVVTVDPPLIDLAPLTAPGQTMQVDMTIENHGLIAAENTRFRFGDHPMYRITPLVSDIGLLPAKSSLTIPVLIERLSVDAAGSGDAADPSMPCGIPAGVDHSYLCGPEEVKKSAGISITNLDVPGCEVPPGAGGPGGVTINPVAFPGVDFIPFEFDGEIECDCEEKTLGEVDLSGWFKPAVEAAEAAINAAIAMTLVSVGLEVEAKGQLILCCKEDESTGLEFRATAGVNAVLRAGPGFNVGVSLSEPLPDGSEATFSGSAFLGAQASLSAGLRGTVSSGCGMDNPRASLNGTVRVGFDIGAKGQVEAKKEGGITPVEVELVGVSGGLFGGVSIIVTYSTDTGLQIRLDSEGVYFEIYVSAFGITVSPFDDPTTPDVETRKYLIPPAHSCSGAAAAPGGDAASAPILSLSAEQVQELLRDEMAKLGLVFNPPAGDAPTQQGDAGGCGCGDTQGDQADGEGVCAHVRLRIDQQAVMTRSAFDAGLELVNNDADMPLEDVLVSIQIVDLEHNDVTDRFGIHAPRLEDIGAVDGTGTVGPGASGNASWLIVPTDAAAPTAPALFGIGGTLSYVHEGHRVIVPLEPVWMTVHPDAALDVKYFHQRDVYADDPWTDEVEPSQPFALAVMVQNHGAGAARNLTITSAQPEILENEKGLLIDFDILATEVAGQNMTPSLTADFGDVAPGSIEIATWWLASTLQGQFIDYAATFEHLDGLGDPRLSLVKSVEIHEMIHVVHADRADEDGLPDFLTNDVADFTQVPGASEWFHDLPDTVHLSDGRVEPVALAEDAAADGLVTAADRVVQLTLSATEGWNYLRMSDPGGSEFQLVEVRRDDGTLVPLDNFWQTDRTFIELGRRPLDEDNLHLFDRMATAGVHAYTLTYAPRDQVGPVVVAIDGPGDEPQVEPVVAVDVTFSEPIDLATLTAADFVLSRDGGPNLLGAGVSIGHVGGAVYRIAGLAAWTAEPGSYTFTASAAGVADPLGNAGTGAASIQWVALGDVPGIVAVAGIPSGATQLPLGFIDVTFSEPIQPGTLGVEDFLLTRDGGANLLGEGLSFTQTGPATFRVGPFADVTADEGAYQLVVSAVGVEDLEGNPGVGQRTFAWTVDTTGPTVDLVLGVGPIVNTPVTSLSITLSELVDPASFDPALAALSRDGGADLLGPGATLSHVSGTTYLLTPLGALTALDGAYELVLSPGVVRDLAGNPSTNAASLAWTMDTQPPAAAAGLTISPDTGESAIDGRTNVLAVTFSGTLAETGLAVTLRDATTGVDLGPATVNGTSFSAPIAFAAAGTHRLRARATDAAGNWVDSFFDVFVDQSNPMVLEVDAPLQFTATSTDRIAIRFSEPMAIAAMLANGSILAAVSLEHLAEGPIALSADQFSYDAATNTLTLSLESFAGALPGGNYEITLDGSLLSDVAGNLLRGGSGGRITFGFPALAPAVFVQADGADLAVDEYSVPAVADWNADGLADLLVGEKTASGQGQVRVYLNVGTAAAPVFEAAGVALLDSGQPVSVPGGGCLGAFPRVADWDRDGRQDLLVGRADGMIELFTNVGASAQPRFVSAGMVQVGSPGAKAALDVGSRATLDVVDWDNDGRFDLVIGGMDGRVHVLIDQALAGAPDFHADDVLTDGSTDLIVPSGRASVAVVDFDADGRKDLVVGNTDGQILFHANVGTDAQPAFGPVQAVLADGLPLDLPGTPRSRPVAADFNDDGIVDLLVGSADGLVRLYLGQAGPAVSEPFNNNDGPPGEPYVFTTTINPTAGILVEPKTGLVTTEAGGTDAFTVVLHSRPSASVTIAVSSSNPAEGLPSVAQLVFTPDDWDQPRTVTVIGQDDDAADGGVGYTIVLAPAASDDPGYAGLDAPDVSVTNLDDDAPPTVTGVAVASSGWTAAFAHADGYAVPFGPDQTTPLPWTRIDRVRITFSEDVVVAQDDLEIRGAVVPEYATSGFHYDAQTWTATWELAMPVAVDRLWLILSDDVADTFGDALDGEWRSGASLGPSGDGNPGGAFVFHVNVVTGDANRDRMVDQRDLAVLASLWLQSGADLAADFNGDGRVEDLDLAILASRLGQQLPIPGDANFDGRVGRADAAALASNWLASDKIWAQGDFNADRRVDDLDLAILAANWTGDDPTGDASAVADRGFIGPRQLPASSASPKRLKSLRPAPPVVDALLE